MKLSHQVVALYGRFSAGARERLVREIKAKGGSVARDLTRRSDLFVVGALATALIDTGSLLKRIRNARQRKVPVLSEKAFATLLHDEAAPDPATLPLATAIGTTALSRDDAEVFAAFGLIVLEDDMVRFADAATLRTAAELLGQGRSRAEAVRILSEAKESAPTGRHRIVVSPDGGAALKWDNGLTTLSGQGFLPFEMDETNIDDLFEAAELAEAAGNGDTAARLYDMCARADRSDAIALFNLGNIRLGERAYDAAVMAYQRALARDPRFVEARYNYALALEALEKPTQAVEELGRALTIEPAYSDAVFNLAQLFLKTGEIARAKSLYERYLALDPPADWAATARKAITYCSSQL
jgi:hypothetical protein